MPSVIGHVGGVIEFGYTQDGWFCPIEFAGAPRADFSAQFEDAPAFVSDTFLRIETNNLVLPNAFAPVDVPTLAASTDAFSRVEAAANLRTDSQPPFEALVAARGDATLWDELQSSPALDALSPTEAQSAARTSVSDTFLPIETLLAALNDAWSPTEGMLTSRADPSVQAELIGAVPMLLGHNNVPIEALGAAVGDVLNPRENTALFLRDVLASGEYGAVLLVDVPDISENVLFSQRGDAISPIEASATSRGDAVSPIEALLLAVRDGSYTEIGASAQIDPSIPAEGGRTVRVDPGAPAEAQGTERVDAISPTESLAGAELDWIPFEFLRQLPPSLDAVIPIEEAPSYRADLMPIVEWAALFVADDLAVAESSRTLAADVARQQPVEAGQTIPIPNLFVGRGRMR